MPSKHSRCTTTHLEESWDPEDTVWTYHQDLGAATNNAFTQHCQWKKRSVDLEALRLKVDLIRTTIINQNRLPDVDYLIETRLRGLESILNPLSRYWTQEITSYQTFLYLHASRKSRRPRAPCIQG